MPRMWRVQKSNHQLGANTVQTLTGLQTKPQMADCIVPSMYFLASLRLIDRQYNVCTNVSKTTKECLGCGEFKTQITHLVQTLHKPWRGSKPIRKLQRRIVWSVHFLASSRLIKSRYKVCTNASNAPIEYLECGKFKNPITHLLQTP